VILSDFPTLKPSHSPTLKPSDLPILKPSELPTLKPSELPTLKPSHSPTLKPSEVPTLKPSDSPTLKPSELLTLKPSELPTLDPIESLTMEPSNQPITVLTSTPSSDSFNGICDGVTSGIDFYNQAQCAPVVRRDPLVFDLNGNGIDLVSLENSRVHFDLNNNGILIHTGWVASTDGLLALDKSNSDSIDNVNELFGNATTTGFTVLARLDTNYDGKIDRNDKQFCNLTIWQDLNQDGVSQLDEIKTLDELEIVSISLAITQVNQVIAGNIVSEISSFTRADGTSGQVAEVLFAVDTVNSIFNFDIAHTAVIQETLSMPKSRGYGLLAPWHIAMSQDKTLYDLMITMTILSPNEIDRLPSLINNFLYRWAGVESISSANRGSFDGQKLAFLEKFTGKNFFQVATYSANPNEIAAFFS